MILKTWNVKTSPSDDFYSLVAEIGFSRLQANGLYLRGLKTKSEILDYVNPSMNADALSMKHLKLAADRIIQAFHKNQRIAIYSDYDVDGITSAALLFLFFKTVCYAHKCDRDILVFFPDRIHEGYGLKMQSVEELHERKIELVITLDNGTSAYDAIEYANQVGIDVVIIDHHRTPDKLPNAFAIVNPKQPDCPYPFKDLCTAGLVYKLSDVLAKELLSDVLRERFLNRYLDLAAIGTYQDMVPLKGENRFLVKQGIQVIQQLRQGQKTSMRGLVELLKLDSKIKKITSEVLGFYIGPRLNSAGRIGKPNRAFQLLVNSNVNEVRHIANELEQLNIQRRKLTLEGCEQACDKIAKDKLECNPILLVDSNQWHPGIIGLIAQRLTQKFKKSSIVLTKSLDDIYVASARAFGNVNIVELISQFEDRLLYYGGHAKAAGFSIAGNQLADFKHLFYEKTNHYLSQFKEEDDIELEVDIVIDFADLYDSQLYDSLDLFEPYGVENESFTLGLRDLKIDTIKASRRGCDTVLKLSSQKKCVYAIAFNDISYLSEFNANDAVSIAFNLSGDEHQHKIQVLGMYPTKT